MSSCDDDVTSIDDEVALICSAFHDEIATTWHEGSRALECSLNSGTWRLKFTFHLPQRYPDVAPLVTVVKSPFDRYQLDDVTERLSAHLTSLIGSPMLFEATQLLFNFAEENHADVSSESAMTSSPVTSTYLIHLDHVRDRTRYFRHLERWCDSEQVGVDVITAASVRGVLLLVQAAAEANCDAFLRRLKSTRGVDVDSRGVKCKEKKSSVICRRQVVIPSQGGERHQVVTGFSVRSFETLESFREHFVGLSLASLFDEFLLRGL